MRDAPSDEDRLVLLAIGGSESAFGELVMRRQAWLRSLLRRMSNDAALADDLCQTAFLKAWRRIGRLKDHRAFAVWLRQIAVRTWVDHLRSQKLHLEDAELDLPAAAVDSADQRLDLQTALARLRPGPRVCTILFFVEGMSHSEIAEAMDLSIGVVKSHIARSTRRLRQALQDWNMT